MFTVYILYSEILKKFYIGQTENLEKRLQEHNQGKSSFTAKGRPWKLVYLIVVDSRVSAMKLEKQIKKRGAKRFLLDNNIYTG